MKLNLTKLMKHSLTYALLASCLAFSGTALAQANLKDDPAYLDIDSAIDLKEITPEVNVNIPKFLLNAALSEFDGGKGDPVAAMGLNLHELTSEIKLVRVVVNAKDENKEKIKRGIVNLKEQLEEDWTAIVSVPDDNVFIYARSDESGNKLAGLALLVADGSDVVIGNVVGNVPIGKIAKVAAQLGGDMIPKELLEKLGGLQVEVEEESTHSAAEEDHDDDEQSDSF